MEERWKQAKDLALLTNRIARSKYKQFYDRTVNSRPFRIGDLVMHQEPYAPAVKGEFFCPRYKGPYKIIQFVAEYAVKIELCVPDNEHARGRVKPVLTHVSKLKHYERQTIDSEESAANDTESTTQAYCSSGSGLRRPKEAAARAETD